MKYSKNILTIAFAAILLIGSAAISVSAQRRGGTRVIVRPVIVHRHYGFHRYWNPWYSGFYGDPYFYDPYLRAQRQRYYLQNELNGNRRELRKHLEKYNADGVITAKEQRELDDDYKDVAKAERKLREFDGE